MTSFAELGLSAPVCRALASGDFDEPFAIQELVIPDALQGRDVLAKSRTGSGKTLAFAAPIVERLDPSVRKPGALVLVPTRELAVQVAQDFVIVAQARKLRVATVYGGVGLFDQAKRASNAHIVVATPGRLEDLAERRLLPLDGIKILVLDEADRMLDMGFQPQVDRIVHRLKGGPSRAATQDNGHSPRGSGRSNGNGPQGAPPNNNGRRQTMMFSATLDGAVGHLARSYTEHPVRHEVEDPKQTVEEADHRFVPVTHHTKIDTLIEILKDERALALVFVRTKRGADRLVYKLKARGVKSAALHGDMTQPARQRTYERFEAGKVDVLVATDIAARGLDLDNITHVINFDPPEDDKGYVHRVGRTARAGRSGTGITLVTPEQAFDVSRVASRLELEADFEREGMTVAPARVVFSSHRGRRSSMRPRPKRKF